MKAFTSLIEHSNLDETIKSLSKLNSFLDENNISCIISDDTTLDNIYKENEYIV